MRVVSALQVRQKLGELLDAAAAGERIVIERDHKPIAVLVSVEDAQRLGETPEERVARVNAALDRLEEIAKAVRARTGIVDTTDVVTMLHEEREARTDQILRAAARKLGPEPEPKDG